MEADQEDVVKTIYIVKQNDNLTAYENTFNEDTFEGPTNVTTATYGFLTEDEAMKFYERRKAMLKVAGTAGMYYTYPTKLLVNSRRAKVIECEAEDGSTYKLLWRAERHLCPQCEGDGTMVNPAIDGNGLSAEDFDQDPDFRESYMRGDYDVKCDCCDGLKYISEPLIDELPENIREDYLRKSEGDRRFEAEVEPPGVQNACWRSEARCQVRALGIRSPHL